MNNTKPESNTNENKPEKKIISLNKHHLWRVIRCSLVVALMLFALMEQNTIDENSFIWVIVGVCIVITLIVWLVWIVANFRYGVAEQNEKSRQHIWKAHSLIINSILTVMAVVALVNFFIEIDFMIHITRENLLYLWVVIIFGFYTLESLFFLLFDRKKEEPEEHTLEVEGYDE